MTRQVPADPRVPEARPADPARKAPGASPEELDRRLKALAYGLEFTKRCSEARSLDEVYLLLTNDIASIAEFDRSFLLVHLGGRTVLAAAGNTPVIEPKTRFYEDATALGRELRDFNRGILISGNVDMATMAQYGLSESAIAALRAYVTSAGCSHMFGIPLSHGGRPMAHLFLEYFPGRSPDETRMVTLLSLAPLLAGVLAQKWLLHRKPALASLLAPGAPGSRGPGRLLARLLLVAGVLLGLSWILFGVQIPVEVGGEAEIAPRERHLAFCQMAGLVDKVLVPEGAPVKRAQVVATLDSRELDHRIVSAERQVQIYESEMAFLQRTAAHGDVGKLAERSVVELKRKSGEAELQFLKAQLAYLEIRSPVEGIVVTRDVQSLAGKKLQAGEPFCEVVADSGLSADVLVPEDRIALVRIGQPLHVFLDADPRSGHRLVVDEIAPRAEVVPRLGNVFRVRAAFRGETSHGLVGMKGIGKVSVARSSLWEILYARVLRTWRKVALFFM